MLKRSQAYIGVLIDDLVTKGTSEPYRIMTSRAEYRLLLRQDNADMRLTPIGRQLGLVQDDRWERFQAKKQAIDEALELLKILLLILVRICWPSYLRLALRKLRTVRACMICCGGLM